MEPARPEAKVFIFASFHAALGKEDSVAAAVRGVIGPTQEERGCLFVDAYRSSLDCRLFYIHSRWADERSFEAHAILPHTAHFLALIGPLLDTAAQITRTYRL